jgi:hypothetical protein
MLKKVRYPSPPMLFISGENKSLKTKAKAHPENLSFNTFSILGDLC